MATKMYSYRDSGVDIDNAASFLSGVFPSISKTYNKNVIKYENGFAGLFRITEYVKKMENPVLVSGTDGVGTKLRLAIEAKKLDTIGQDLVAMCVNDILTCGAIPLFFLDYFATGKLALDTAPQIIKGIVEACCACSCALIGGETAEMPGFYQENDFDLAGFAVGIVDEKNIITGKNVCAGDIVLGLSSSGFHSNGYSLIRKMIHENQLDLHQNIPSLHSKTLLAGLLEPTYLYSPVVLKVLEKYPQAIHAMAHITGGGFYENIPRVMPVNTCCTIQKSDIPVNPVIDFMVKRFAMAEKELFTTFNMGIGYILIVDKNSQHSIFETTQELLKDQNGISIHTIGYISQHQGNPTVELI